MNARTEHICFISLIDILIGNCGLFLATGFQKNGIDYTVFEKESEDGERLRTEQYRRHSC